MKLRSARSAVRSARRGAGTLIFLAFMVLVILVVMGLFQWFSRFITAGNKIFNEEAIARSLAESGVNEVLCQFCAEVNKYPLSASSNIAEYQKFLEAKGGESCLKSAMATKLAKDPVSAGGYGLERLGDVEVKIKAVNERPITDVDRRGLLQFSCTVTVGATTHVATRSFEYFRYLIIPPHRLGRFAFAAFNWVYYRDRYYVYLHSLLQHRVARAICVAFIQGQYDLKGTRAVGATEFADKVVQVLKSPPASVPVGNNQTRTINGKGDALDLLAEQLDGYHNQFLNATKTATDASRTAPGDDGKWRGQFTIPYFIRMANAKTQATALKGVSTEVKEISLDFDNTEAKDEERYRLRSKGSPTFRQLTQFMPELKTPPTEASEAWANGLCTKFQAEFEKHWDEDSKLLQRTIAAPDGTQKPSGVPFYVEGHKRPRLFSEELEFNNVKIPTAGENGQVSSELTSNVPKLAIPPADDGIQRAANSGGSGIMAGACFFGFDPADLGMHSSAPNAAAAQPAAAQGGTPARAQNLMTAAELAARNYDGTPRTATPAQQGGTPDWESPNQNGFLGQDWANNTSKDSFVDQLLSEGQGDGFGGDLSQWQKFKTWWVDSLDKFKKCHVEGGSTEANPTGDNPPDLNGQITRHKSFLKLASVDTEEPPPGVTLDDENKIDNVKAVTHIGAGYQKQRACFSFKTPQKFYEYIKKSLGADPKDVMKLAGLYFVETGDLVLPCEKYTGTGMISAAGNITVPKGIKKFNDKADGNLILIAGGDIIMGGEEADCALIATGSYKKYTGPTSTPGPNPGTGRLLIKGNLIVGDTATADGTTKSPSDMTAMLAPDASRLPSFVIEWDKNLIDDKNCMLIVMCPYRGIQLVERKRGMFGRSEAH